MPSTLARALSQADATVTILDDKMVVEDAAVYRWLRAHHLRGKGLTHFAIGIGPLPTRYYRLAKVFSSPTDVTRFINDADLHGSSKILTDLCRQLPGGALIQDKTAKETLITNAILYNQAWVLEVRRIPNPFVTKTSPSIFPALNAQHSTSIDFSFLASLEGNQWLRGYVPMRGKSGRVAGQSGMTVATGFDIGQRTMEELRQTLVIPEDLIQILAPFVQVQMAGLSRIQVVDKVSKLGPVPILTKTQADILDQAIMGEPLDMAIGNWDSHKGRDVPLFRSMPGNWQTVWFSRHYQEGIGPHYATAKKFRKDARSGAWQDAIDDLQNYTQYTDRASKEAALLQTQLPAIVESAKTPENTENDDR